jgi:hypothetical protein
MDDAPGPAERVCSSVVPQPPSAVKSAPAFVLSLPHRPLKVGGAEQRLNVPALNGSPE